LLVTTLMQSSIQRSSTIPFPQVDLVFNESSYQDEDNESEAALEELYNRAGIEEEDDAEYWEPSSREEPSAPSPPAELQIRGAGPAGCICTGSWRSDLCQCDDHKIRTRQQLINLFPYMVDQLISSFTAGDDTIIALGNRRMEILGKRDSSGVCVDALRY
jgi:hypothetical protein